MTELIKPRPPFLHNHHLVCDYYRNPGTKCNECNEPIHGQWAYCCETCDYNYFWLHFYCARNKLLPRWISNPHLHPQHRLSLEEARRPFICHKCLCISKGHRYRCKEMGCNFKVDILCSSTASATTTTTTNDFAGGAGGGGGLRGIRHFIHEGWLRGAFNYRKVSKEHYDCRWCGKHLSGPSFGCFKEMCLGCRQKERFYIHESCLINIPTKILSNPFHSQHPLQLTKSWSRCNACKCPISLDHHIGEYAYGCQRCQFYLHPAPCSTLHPTLKLDQQIHPHTLTFMQIYIHQKHPPTSNYQCNICHLDIDDYSHGSKKLIFYRCVLCDLDFHLGCLGILPSVTHEYHTRHPLQLVEQFKDDDDSGEYYCDICEQERNGRHLVYCCQECKFAAHIECALNKQQVESNTLMPKLMEQEETEMSSTSESHSHGLEKQIDHMFHKHPLIYYELTKKEEDLLLCEACNLEVDDEAYGCESCKYYLHKQCSKLSSDLLHPLHPQHSLQLSDDEETLLCDGCNDLSLGFKYICYRCDFVLDVKCATSTSTSPTLAEPSYSFKDKNKILVKETKLCPFEQDHELVLFNTRRHQLKGINFQCNFCFLQMSGPTYFCTTCRYFLHESCLGFPLELRLPILPTHPFQPFLNRPHISSFEASYPRFCFACLCGFSMLEIVYNCKSLGFDLHLACAKSLWRTLESKSHEEHPLFYFGTECQKLFAIIRNNSFFCYENIQCEKCHESFYPNVPFYRCIVCQVSFHLECALVPHFIASTKYHIHHPLTLQDCFTEDDDSEEYYCDICEEERHPKHNVYVCEDCKFVADIECVLNINKVSSLDNPKYISLFQEEGEGARLRRGKPRGGGGALATQKLIKGFADRRFPPPDSWKDELIELWRGLP